MRYVLLALLLTGCASDLAKVAAETPTLQYCRHVKYERDNNEAKFEATCNLPIGGSAVPALPLPGL